MASLTSTQACRDSRDSSSCCSMVSSRCGVVPSCINKSSSVQLALPPSRTAFPLAVKAPTGHHPRIPELLLQAKFLQLQFVPPFPLPCKPTSSSKHDHLPSIKMSAPIRTFTGSWESHKHPALKEPLNITYFTALSV